MSKINHKYCVFLGQLLYVSRSTVVCF